MISHLSVGVIIATYNRYDMCVEAVRSALSQTHTNLQVFVIDDQSTDERYASLERTIGDERLHYIRLDPGSKQTLGTASPGFVRNAGIRAFQGDYVAILDDDDLWLSDKIEKQLNYMLKTGAKACCSDSFFYNVRWQRGETIGSFVPLYNETCHIRPREQLTPLSAKLYKIEPKHLKEKNYVIHSSFVAERSLFEAVGMYNMQRFHQDYVLMKKIVEKTPFILLVDEPLLAYDNRGRLQRKEPEAVVLSAPGKSTARQATGSFVPVIILFLLYSLWRK